MIAPSPAVLAREVPSLGWKKILGVPLFMASHKKDTACVWINHFHSHSAVISNKEIHAAASFAV